MNRMLCENIHWVGYVDWTVRDFHSYRTDQGTSYNAYLILDQQPALVDTVKAPYAGTLLRNVAELIDPAAIQYVVCNHAEPDHAGALPQVLAALPNATLLCNKKCARILCQYFDVSGWKIREVSDTSRVSLGRYSLQFPQTPLVHWPESMFSYVPEARLLFSMDAFGQHYAAAERFDDEAPLDAVMDAAKTYYANIVTPYDKTVCRTLDQASTLDINMIAPSHGLIWRNHISRILKAYADWSAGRCAPKVLVVFDSMWESTTQMAETIADAATQSGVTVKLIHLRKTELTYLAAEMLDAAAIAFGSPTLNAAMTPAVGAALTYMRGLKIANKAGAAFGSYGWCRGGPEEVHDALTDLKWDMRGEPLKAQYRPTPEILDQCRELGQWLAEKAIMRSQSGNHAPETNG